MSEISNMFLPNKEILDNLKSYIEAKYTSQKVWVGRTKISNQNPMVVFSEARNELESKSTTYDNTTRIMNYNINVYCHTLKNSYEVVMDLCILICEVMQGYYKMNGGIIASIMTYTENDKSGFKANLRFTTRYIPNIKKIY